MATGRSRRRVEAESRPEVAVFRGTLGVVVENQVRARMVGLSRFIHECEPDLLWPESLGWMGVAVGFGKVSGNVLDVRALTHAINAVVLAAMSLRMTIRR